MAEKTAFVSGCFDLMHSGHVEFFRRAAAYGALTVALGSDRTIYALKRRATVCPEQERLFMVHSCRYVNEAFISQGQGMLDWLEHLVERRPSFFVVCQDGDTQAKRDVCQQHGVEYVVLERTPNESLRSLEARSTTDLRRVVTKMPYRIDICGGWLDQPQVSKHHPGCVITVSIQPTIAFNNRSGMASSTRHTALGLWGASLPSDGNHELHAHTLFCKDNPPGTAHVSGSQDSIGIVYPGLALSLYRGAFWPSSIRHDTQAASLDFVERCLRLVPLGERRPEFDVYQDSDFSAEKAAALAGTAERCWAAIERRDVASFGRCVYEGFRAQVAMFPQMENEVTKELVARYLPLCHGLKLSGCGGGGYLILVTEDEVEGSLPIKVRRH